MGRPKKSSVVSTRGKGQCGNPYCRERRAPDHYLCAEHLKEILQIKEEIDGGNLFLRRSDNSDREISSGHGFTNADRGSGTGIKSPRTPTCCHVGCYEPRVPPNPYCYIHENLASEDD